MRLHKDAIGSRVCHNIEHKCADIYIVRCQSVYCLARPTCKQAKTNKHGVDSCDVTQPQTHLIIICMTYNKSIDKYLRLIYCGMYLFMLLKSLNYLIIKIFITCVRMCFAHVNNMQRCHKYQILADTNTG